VWALKPKVKWENKFDAILSEGTLMGYENNYSCSRIFCHEDKQFEYTHEVQFDEWTFPHLPAMNRSMTVRARSIDNAWVFVSDPIVLYDDFPTIKDNPPAADLPEEPVEDFPSNPESSLWWIYVPEYTHENFINSTINESNIVEGKRACCPLCFIFSLANPKSHNLAMKSSNSLQCKEALPALTSQKRTFKRCSNSRVQPVVRQALSN
jgi:hypothetical protein